MPRPERSDDEAQPFEGAGDELRSVSYVRLKIDSAGRIVIPASMRAAMMVKPGDTVTAEVVDGELRVLSRSVIFERLRAEAQRSRTEHPGSAVDELIAERREETRREDEKFERIAREAAAGRKTATGRP